MRGVLLAWALCAYRAASLLSFDSTRVAIVDRNTIIMYKWVRFKGGRWEVVEFFRSPSTEVVRGGIREWVPTKLIIEWGPTIHIPEHLTYTEAQSKAGKRWPWEE